MTLLGSSYRAELAKHLVCGVVMPKKRYSRRLKCTLKVEHCFKLFSAGRRVGKPGTTLRSLKIRSSDEVRVDDRQFQIEALRLT